MRLLHTLLTIFCVLLHQTQAQTVDLSIENNSSPSSQDNSFEAAMKIVYRNYETLKTKYKKHSSSDQFHSNLYEEWEKWINNKFKEINASNGNAKENQIESLLKIVRNRAAYYSELINAFDDAKDIFAKSTYSPEYLNQIAEIRFLLNTAPWNYYLSSSESGFFQVQSRIAFESLSFSDPDAVSRATLGCVLETMVINDFPEDIHPEQTTKRLSELDKFLARRTEFDTIISRNIELTKILPESKASEVSAQNEPLKILSIQSSLPAAFFSGDLVDLLTLSNAALSDVKKAYPDKPDLALGANLLVSKLNHALGNKSKAYESASEAVKLAAANHEITSRNKCLAYIYNAKMAYTIGKNDDGNSSIIKAIEVFNNQIDSGYPYTGRESPLISGILTSIIEGLMNQASGDTLQKGFSLMAEPIERLVASAECRGVVPSEQLMLDAMQTSLLFARMMLVSGNTKEAEQIANHIIETFDTFQRDPNFTLSKQVNIYLDSLALSAYCSKKQGSEKAAPKLVQDWLKNYKTRINETIQGASEQQRMRFATQQQPFDFVASMEDPLAVAEMSFFSKGAVLESLMTQKKVVSQTADVDLKNQMAMIQKLKSQLQGKGDSQSEALQKLGENERTLAENVRRSFKESDILEILKNSNFRSIPKNIPPDSAFIDFIQFSEFGSLSKGSKRYAAIVISDKGKLTFQKLAPVSEVDTLITEFRALVSKSQNTESDKKLESICRELHDKLINPFKAQLKGVKELVVCPDGNLNFVPFGAFLDENNKFLLQSRTIRYVSSGRDLLRSVSSNPSKEMLIVANPKFNGSDSTDSEPFSPLPGTKVEASAATLAMQNSGYKVDVIEQTDATEEKLKSAKSPRILHIATHGFNLSGTHGSDSDPTKRGMKVTGLVSNDKANSEIPAVILPNEPNPMFRTGLALNRANDTFSEWVKGNQPASDNDGILQAGEVPTIDLTGTWIVILSACQTGEGAAMGGEGVFGLKRGFLQAGANNLIMTLWPIADKETSEIMTDFYQKIAEGSNDPGLNLCDIQKTWMERLRAEKGTAFAINRAAPFIMTTQGKISRGPLAQK